MRILLTIDPSGFKIDVDNKYSYQGTDLNDKVLETLDMILEEVKNGQNGSLSRQKTEEET
jgi:hypothetical protein